MNLNPGRLNRWGILSRSASGKEPVDWYNFAEESLITANKVKYEQNPELRSELFLTEGQRLVEAARDKQWGCGCHKKDRRCYDPIQWTGINWVGDLLTCIWEKMMLETEENQFAEEARSAHRTLTEIKVASSRVPLFAQDQVPQ